MEGGLAGLLWSVNGTVSPPCRPSEKGQCLHWARLFLMHPQGQLRSSRKRENDTRPPTLEGLERRKRGTKFPHSESHPGLGTLKMTINGF